MPEASDFFHWLIIYHEIARRLNSDSIRVDTLTDVEEMIAVWQKLLPRFLGDEQQTYNAHATKHLVHFTRNLGPLHNFSTFCFEGFNGMLSRMPTGPNGRMGQVARRYVQEKFVIHWLQKIKQLPSANELRKLVKESCKKEFTFELQQKRYGVVKLMQAPELAELSLRERMVVRSFFPDIQMPGVLSVSSVKVRSTLLRSEFSERNGSFCTHAAKFSYQGGFLYVIISKILIIREKVFAFCKKFEVKHNFMDIIPEPKCKLIRSLWRKETVHFCKPYGNFFDVVELTSDYAVLPFDDFCCRCIIIPSKPMVITEECMIYEHN